MNKRWRRYLIITLQILLCVLIISFLARPFIIYKRSVKCPYPIQEEVLLVAEFGKINDTDNDISGVGVVSFKVDDILYSIGHYSTFEDSCGLEVYKVLPTFKPATEDDLGGIYCKYNTQELIGTVIQDSDDGMIISAEDFNTTAYSSIPVANQILPDDAELAIRDETGKLQYYSVSVKVAVKDGEGFLSFTVKDERLLDKTGGIIPGMSGSPIIQNGKLIGIVTHTYTNKPWRGIAKIIWNVDCIKSYSE